MRPVIVCWLDSVRHNGGWALVSEYRERSTQEGLQHQTLGWVVCETEDSVTLAQSRSVEEQNDEGDVNVTEVIQIPRVAITSLKELDLDGKEAPRLQGGSEKDSVGGVFG